jgi:hypothetical protein
VGCETSWLNVFGSDWTSNGGLRTMMTRIMRFAVARVSLVALILPSAVLQQRDRCLQEHRRSFTDDQEMLATLCPSLSLLSRCCIPRSPQPLSLTRRRYQHDSERRGWRGNLHGSMLRIWMRNRGQRRSEGFRRSGLALRDLGVTWDTHQTTDTSCVGARTKRQEARVPQESWSRLSGTDAASK